MATTQDFSKAIESFTLKYKCKEQNTSCPICFDGVQLEEEVRRLPCLHVFHTDCVDSWLQKRGFCPKCRKNLSNGEISDIEVMKQNRKKNRPRIGWEISGKNNNYNNILEEYNYLDDRDDYIIECRNARKTKRRLLLRNNSNKSTIHIDNTDPIQIDDDNDNDDDDDDLVVVEAKKNVITVV